MAEVLNCPGCKIVRVKFEWDVQVPFLQTTDGNGKSIESPTFSSKQTPGSKWKLVLFDRGTICVIAAYHIDSTSRLNEVDPELLKMTIMKDNAWPYYCRQILAFHPAGCQILKTEAFLQSDGSLKFECAISALEKSEPVSTADSLDGIAINCSGGLVTQFQGLFDKMQFSDVILNVGDQEFPAHKLILAARSNVFAAMFGHPTKENLTNQIKIEDIKPEVFQELLSFIYTGRVFLDRMESMGVELLIAADKYLLEDLKMECENYLLRKLSPVSCLEILLNENLPGSAEQLKKEAADFFRCHLEEVMSTDKWKMIKLENPAFSFAFQEFLLSNN